MLWLDVSHVIVLVFLGDNTSVLVTVVTVSAWLSDGELMSACCDDTVSML